jgi:hypothetical protein
LVQVVEPGQIVDLHLVDIKTIRFLLTRGIDNPLLSLFSNKEKRVIRAFGQIMSRGNLLAGISKYIYEIFNHHNYKEILNMYTKEDFLRDHPPENRPHFLFAWEEKYHKEEIAKATQRAELKGKLEGELKGKLEGELKALEKLYEEGILLKEQFLERATPLREKLQNILIGSQTIH